VTDAGIFIINTVLNGMGRRTFIPNELHFHDNGLAITFIFAQISQMKLFVVNDARTAREFLDVHVTLNKGREGWNQPLDKDVEDVFDPAKNKAFRFGECIRWVMKDDKGQLAGRVAAFVNKNTRPRATSSPWAASAFLIVRTISRPPTSCSTLRGNGWRKEVWGRWTGRSTSATATAGGACR